MKWKNYMRLAIGLICVLFFACKENRLTYLPNFDLLLSDSSTILNTSQIPTGKPVIMVFFSPDCEYCQTETSDILGHIDSLKNVRIYFATVDPFARLKVFNEHYNIAKYSNVITGRDFTFSLPKFFNISSPPYTIVCDQNKKIKVIFSGTPKPGKIVEVVNSL